MRIRWPRRVSAQVLPAQLAITDGRPRARHRPVPGAARARELDDQAMRRALSIAQTTAADPDLARELATTATDPGAVRCSRGRADPPGRPARCTSWCMDTRGVRWSHTNPARIGGTSPPTRAPRSPAGRSGRSTPARWAARPAPRCPLRDAHGRIVGAVSVGIAYDSVQRRLLEALPGLLLYAGAALAVGVLAAVGALPQAAAPYARRGLRRHLRAARRAGGDAARHPRGRRRASTGTAGSGWSTTRRSGCSASDADATGRALDDVLPPGPDGGRAGRAGRGARPADRQRRPGAGRQPDADAGRRRGGHPARPHRTGAARPRAGQHPRPARRAAGPGPRARQPAAHPARAAGTRPARPGRGLRRRGRPTRTGRPRSRSPSGCTTRCCPRCWSARRRSRPSGACRCGSRRSRCCRTRWSTRATW